MTGTAPESFLIGLGAAMHGAPVLALTALALAAWVIADLGDGPSALAILITAAISLLFVIHRLLPLAPDF